MAKKSAVSVTDIRGEQTRRITRGEIPPGTFFMGDVGRGVGLHLRAFKTIVKLDDPSDEWDNGAPDAAVYNYVPVRVEILVKENV